MAKVAADRFIEFVNRAPSQFHAVAELGETLKKAGFTKLFETDVWKIEKGGKYFMTRNQSCIIAFSVGQKWAPGNGFVMSAAHTDSPVLKLKPISKITKASMLQIGVQVYGGGLWHTWFDRGLSLAGRVLVTEGENVRSILVDVKEPICVIPNLAIHLNRDPDGFKPNLETEIVPILASQLKANLVHVDEEGKPQPSVTADFADNHHSVLIDAVAKAANVDAKSIIDFELCLYDTQQAERVGLYKEFIAARGLDNLLMSWVCNESLIASSTDAVLEKSEDIKMVALFDNEEIGSGSQMGAASNILNRVLGRITGDDTLDMAMAKSILISADMAHAEHPNYRHKHEDNHRVQIHGGLVVKENANLRYATSSVTSSHLARIAKINNIPLQRFCIRQDMGCGSTVGPILSAGLGVRTVDVGVPQWGMHSVRETCGIDDVESSYKLISEFYQKFTALDKKFIVDNQ